MEFQIEHLGLPSRDPRSLKDWYVSALGARVLYESGQEPPTYFVLLAGGPMIEIYAGDASRPETANNRLTGWRHLALRSHAGHKLSKRSQTGCLREEVHKRRRHTGQSSPEMNQAKGISVPGPKTTLVIVREELGFVGRHVYMHRALAFATFARKAQVQ